MRRTILPKCFYEFEEIWADVEEAMTRAAKRMREGGMDVDETRPEEIEDFKRLLSAVLDVTAWTVSKRGEEIRWNRRAVKLFAEVLAVGFYARAHYGEPALTAWELREYLGQLRIMANSAKHCDA